MLPFTTRAIALSVEANSLPSEFRMFVAGWNDTEHGRFLFDETAAASVMQAYREWGVDLAIDLEHQMLDPVPSADPTARDARGWAKLELRADGSLWAVDVRWTIDGAARLSEKRQRYVSPAFEIDPETKRVTKIINVAITALPATHHTPALIAATRIRLAEGKDSMTLEEMLKVAEALGLGADATFEDFMAKIAGLKAAADATSTDEPDAAPAEPPAPVENAAPAAPAAPPAAEDDEEKKAAVAACARIVRLSAKETITAALDEVDVWRASHLELEEGRQKLAAERKTLESAERRSLCVELVKCGAEFPGTVWADPVSKSPELKPRWQKMPIEELRTHVAEQKAARADKSKKTDPIVPPTGNAGEAGSKTFMTPDGEVTLSARELKYAAEAGAKPEVMAANKAKQEKASRRGR